MAVDVVTAPGTAYPSAEPGLADSALADSALADSELADGELADGTPEDELDGPAMSDELAMVDGLAHLFVPTAVQVGVASLAEGTECRLPESVLLTSPHSPRRAAEYAAGRLAARRALRAMTGQASWIERGSDGRPVWPAGIRASISHSASLAVCVVSTATVGVGVDIEGLPSAEHLYRGQHLFADAREQRLIAEAADSELAALRLFSAKEAAFKALPVELQADLMLRGLPLSFDPAALGTVTLHGRAGALPPLRVMSIVNAEHMISAAICAAGR